MRMTSDIQWINNDTVEGIHIEILAKSNKPDMLLVSATIVGYSLNSGIRAQFMPTGECSPM